MAFNGYNFILEIGDRKSLYKNPLKNSTTLNDCIALLDQLKNSHDLYKNNLMPILKKLHRNYLISIVDDKTFYSLLQELQKIVPESENQLKSFICDYLKSRGFINDDELIETFFEDNYTMTENNEDKEPFSNIYNTFKRWYRDNYPHIKLMCRREMIDLIRQNNKYSSFIKGSLMHNIKLKFDDNKLDQLYIKQ